MSTPKSTSKKFSHEVRERAVRVLFEHEEEFESQWAAMASIAEIGSTTETLPKWVRQAERGKGAGPRACQRGV